MDSKKILLIEDEPIYYTTYEELLNNAGYKTTVAKNGEEALQILEKEQFDLIILDLIMPIMTGKTFLEEVKKKNITSSIVVLTALEGDSDRIDVLKAGAKKMLVKGNLSADKLLEEIENTLNEHA